jgi:hypothetical protein
MMTCKRHRSVQAARLNTLHPRRHTRLQARKSFRDERLGERIGITNNAEESHASTCQSTSQLSVHSKRLLYFAATKRQMSLDARHATHVQSVAIHNTN